MNSIKNDWGSLVPKIETQALEFVVAYPQFDGRGVIVGVLDTGIDPGAIGLQTTTDDKPKIIDSIDCTGSGDVSMEAASSTVDEHGYIGGVGNRKIKVNPKWTNPSGKYLVGVKVISNININYYAMS
jgi:tripeptidyl-peptidase-2